MKKTMIALLLVLTLLFSACSSAKSDAQPTEEPEQEVETSAAEPTVEIGDEENDEEFVKLGAVDGYTYTNDFLGYGCTLDGWVFATQEEIAELNNIVIDSANTEELQDMLRNSEAIMDMYAVREDGMANVNINFQNLNMLFGRMLTEEMFRDQTYPQMQSSMEGMGMTNVKVEKVMIEIDGTEHPGLFVSSEKNGVPLFQRQACVKCNGYIAGITVSTFGEDTTEAVFDLFYHL